MRRVPRRRSDSAAAQDHLLADTKAKTEGEEKSASEEEYEERYINLGAKNSAPMKPGDRIIINTPGGGAWGAPGKEKVRASARDHTEAWKKGSHAAREDAALQA